MDTKEHGGPAFPQSAVYSQNHDQVYPASAYGAEEGMTLRQYAAINLRVPDSGIDWLDGMIREARILDSSEKILAMLMHPESQAYKPSASAEEARRFAVALMHQRGAAV